MKRTAKYFKDLGDELGKSLGEQKIEVKKIPSTWSTKFIKCYSPNGTLYFTEQDVLKCEELGLSLRRAS